LSIINARPGYVIKRKLSSYGPETNWRDMLVTFFLNWNKIKDTLKDMKSEQDYSFQMLLSFYFLLANIRVQKKEN